VDDLPVILAPDASARGAAATAKAHHRMDRVNRTAQRDWRCTKYFAGPRDVRQHALIGNGHERPA